MCCTTYNVDVREILGKQSGTKQFYGCIALVFACIDPPTPPINVRDCVWMQLCSTIAGAETREFVRGSPTLIGGGA